MEWIQRVIRETDTPSWINSVPRQFGESKAGTLKAAEWRIMAAIYLPIALVTMWGDGTTHSSAERGHHLREVLDHTMALFSAAHVACLRTTSHSRTAAYKNYMIAYVKNLQTLHPDVSVRPNHHMALHIYEFLEQFGPVHSWWTFPFERLIGILQRLPTNHIHGEPAIKHIQELR